jgi:hypothetical protein
MLEAMSNKFGIDISALVGRLHEKFIASVPCFKALFQ